MVKHYWERHADFRAAIEAVREALIEAEIAESTYHGIIAQTHQGRAYIMEQRQADARTARSRYLAAIQQAMEHLNDAMSAWSTDD